MQRRQLLTMIAVSAMTGSASAWAQNTTPLTLVVPFAPGASVDTLSRLIARAVTERTGQTVLVDNRPGANGIIGAELVKNAPAEARQLFIANVGSHAINVPLYGKRLPYDAAKDFSAITLLWRFPSVLAVPASSPAKDVASLVQLAQTQGITFASAGNGSGGHLLGEMLKQATGATQMLHVPYKGAAAAATDVVAGQLPVTFGSFPGVMPFVISGKLRVLGVAADKPTPLAPEIPVLKDLAVTSWYGLFAPAGTPQPIIDKVHTAIAKVLATPEMKERLKTLGAESVDSNPQSFAASLPAELAHWKKVVDASGAKID